MTFHSKMISMNICLCGGGEGVYIVNICVFLECVCACARMCVYACVYVYTCTYMCDCVHRLSVCVACVPDMHANVYVLCVW